MLAQQPEHGNHSSTPSKFSASFIMDQHGAFWLFLGSFASFASMCGGGKDTPPPCVGGGELKKHDLEKNHLDGEGWVLGPSKGLEGLKVGHDIILRRLLKIGNLGTKLVK